ncbi:ATP-dependent helicase HrpB [Planctomicrobium sp. SH661]|uniref:ATP-dependent helicase HrpB n=1 Tax=Planctomicrobium sp. SH661 TaxID=3448124 RepID=UPI003F5BE82A
MSSSELSELPIDAVLPELLSELESCGKVVLRAPTGAGKTTRVPPAILDKGIAGSGRIIMLEPRRIAARAAAARIAREQGTVLGREVGYQVRFDSKFCRDTRILVVTEGVLLRQLQLDPFLDGVSVVVFDEFHERNLASDLALGMVRRIQQTVRPDLKIVVMSATLDPGPIAAYLNDAAVVESLGRSYPVEIEYLKQRDTRNIVEAAVWGVHQVFPRTKGHLLVFLPGVGEIHKTRSELEDYAHREKAQLLPLYGDLPPEAQDQVLAPSQQRKIVLATNVAETSVTIAGVTAVIDTGVARILRYDPQTGLDRLELEPISQASADQRAGRAGRTQAGICLRLWDEKSHRLRSEQTDPEIRRVDLTGPVLQLKSWGEGDILAFPWFEAPRGEAVERAQLLLERLGACSESGEVTALGRSMVELPVHPRIARMLLAGHAAGESRRAAWLAALLEERDPFFRSRQGHHSRVPPPTVLTHHSQSDVLDRLSALEESERSGHTEFPWGTLNRGAARQIGRVRDQLQQLLRDVKLSDPPTENLSSDEVLMRALVAAFPDRVAKRRAVGSDKGLMVGGRGVKLAPQSSVRTGDLFLCVDVDAGQTDALVRQASAVEPDWLPESNCRSVTEHFFHPTQKQVVARRREYFADLILAESPAALPDGDAAAELLFKEAVSAWNQVFPADDETIQGYLQRVRSLSEWMPDLELPAFDSAQLHQALRNLCTGLRSFAELKKADWLIELQSLLTWSQRQAVEKEAPAFWQVPSGSQIRLQYELGRPPVLAVRIQEIFGMASTPRIAGGRVRILLHLLAPNRQPQQVTEDLASFWANTYPAVRKEMARRYPRHPWPEDPLTAPAIRK